MCHACLLLAIHFCLPRSDMSNALCKGCGNISDAASPENHNSSFTGFRLFFFPSSLQMCYFTEMEQLSTGEDELGLDGKVKDQVQSGPLCSQSPPSWASIRWRSWSYGRCLGHGNTLSGATGSPEGERGLRLG